MEITISQKEALLGKAAWLEQAFLFSSQMNEKRPEWFILSGLAGSGVLRSSNGVHPAKNSTEYVV